MLFRSRPFFSNRFHTFPRPPNILSFRAMSSAHAIKKLPESLHSLVIGAVQEGDASSDFGKSEKDQAEVSAWIERIADGEVTKPENVKVRGHDTSYGYSMIRTRYRTWTRSLHRVHILSVTTLLLQMLPSTEHCIQFS